MKFVYALIISVIYAVFSPLIFWQIPLTYVLMSNRILVSLLLGMGVLIFDVVEINLPNTLKHTLLFLIILYFIASGVFISIGANVVINAVFITVYISLFIVFYLLKHRYI